MTGFDYPPTKAWDLQAARERAQERADTADDATDRRRAENQADALGWAVSEFGGEASVELAAYTAQTRARVLDTLQTEIAGDIGPEETQLWLVAAGVESAPWFDDHDLPSKAAATNRLPPALVEWLNSELDDLNDLSEGN